MVAAGGGEGSRFKLQASGQAASEAGKLRQAQWLGAVRDKLRRIDPRLVEIFNARWNRFGGDCSASAVLQFLRAQQLEWLGSKASFYRWYDSVLEIEAATPRDSHP